MNYNLSEEQIMLKDSARKFLTKHCTSEFVREMIGDTKRFSQQLWNSMAELGWMSLLVPEIYDGHGGVMFSIRTGCPCGRHGNMCCKNTGKSWICKFIRIIDRR